MNQVKIVTHFSIPNWPVVNKLSGIAKCFGVSMTHCPTVASLSKTMNAAAHKGPILLFTDEGLHEFVVELDGRKIPDLEVALIISSSLNKAAEKVTDISIVKYFMSIDFNGSYGRDLSILVKKFIERDVLDLKKYLAFGAILHHRVIDSNTAKAEAVTTVKNYISALGGEGYEHPYAEYSQRVATLVDELLLNAVFNANPRLKTTDRALTFALEPAEQIQVSWGYDGDYFGVSVRDPFGTFACETITKYVSAERSAEDIVGSPSAGLGLQLIFEKAQQVIANVQSNEVTELIALVRFENRLSDYEKKGKSFYYFSGASKKVI